MRFSAATLLALPLLATAAESPLDQYKAKFQNFLGSFGAKPPAAPFQQAAAPGSADSKGKSKGVKSKNIDVLTLENWDQTLFAPVKAESTTPEEVWVLVSGGNKTCFGTCAMLCRKHAMKRERDSETKTNELFDALQATVSRSNRLSRRALSNSQTSPRPPTSPTSTAMTSRFCAAAGPRARRRSGSSRWCLDRRLSISTSSA